MLALICASVRELGDGVTLAARPDQATALLPPRQLVVHRPVCAGGGSPAAVRYAAKLTYF